VNETILRLDVVCTESWQLGLETDYRWP